MIRRDRNPSLGRFVAGGLRWWVIFTVVFFVTFPLWGRPSLRVLAFILDGLNNFGSGY